MVDNKPIWRVIIKNMAIYRTYHPASSNLRVSQYNTDTKILRILFKSQNLYLFYNVPKRIYELIANASPRGGKIFWRSLARNYPYRKINRSGSISDTSQD